MYKILYLDQIRRQQQRQQQELLGYQSTTRKWNLNYNDEQHSTDENEGAVDPTANGEGERRETLPRRIQGPAPQRPIRRSSSHDSFSTITTAAESPDNSSMFFSTTSSNHGGESSVVFEIIFPKSFCLSPVRPPRIHQRKQPVARLLSSPEPIQEDLPSNHLRNEMPQREQTYFGKKNRELVVSPRIAPPRRSLRPIIPSNSMPPRRLPTLSKPRLMRRTSDGEGQEYLRPPVRSSKRDVIGTLFEI